MVDMYNAVSPADLRNILNGEVPPHVMEVPKNTLGPAVLLASIAVSREFTPPRTAMDVMQQAMPIINHAAGVEVASI